MATPWRLRAIILPLKWCAAWQKTTFPSWAPIFGDNEFRVALQRLRRRSEIFLIPFCILALAAILSSAQTTTKKSSTSKSTTSSKTASKTRHKTSPRLQRMRRAFVASASLRPMAQQLLQDRTPAAYAGVESYARAHSKEDAGALAWLVVGYAHT